MDGVKEGDTRESWGCSRRMIEREEEWGDMSEEPRMAFLCLTTGRVDLVHSGHDEGSWKPSGGWGRWFWCL
jgi:hypothetical protein